MVAGTTGSPIRHILWIRRPLVVEESMAVLHRNSFRFLIRSAIVPSVVELLLSVDNAMLQRVVDIMSWMITERQRRLLMMAGRLRRLM